MSPAGQQRERWIFRGVLDRDRDLHPDPPLTKKERRKREDEEITFEMSRLFAEHHRSRFAYGPNHGDNR